MTLFDELKPFVGANFRELYQKFVYIDCKELLDVMLPGEVPDDITGVFAYGYIDSTEGLSFRPFSLAKMSAGTMQVFTFPHQEDTIFILRIREKIIKMSEVHNGNKHMYLYAVDPKKYHYFDLQLLNFPIEKYAEFKADIDANYKVDEHREKLRSSNFSFLDQFRNGSYPDDVSVLLVSENNGIEQVWVRMLFAAEKEIFGELLNEPYQDYGCHEGEIIGFAVAKAEEDRVLVYTGHIARKE